MLDMSRVRWHPALAADNRADTRLHERRAGVKIERVAT